MFVTLCVLMWERKHSNPFLAGIAENFLLLEFAAIAICCAMRFIGIIREAFSIERRCEPQRKWGRPARKDAPACPTSKLLHPLLHLVGTLAGHDAARVEDARHAAHGGEQHVEQARV